MGVGVAMPFPAVVDVEGADVVGGVVGVVAVVVVSGGGMPQLRSTQ
jgi:hypothetical protein